MTEPDRAMLLSVRPRYAESILEGTKRVEIRRQRPGAQPGTPVIIYATKPVAAVVGTAHIDRVCKGNPSDLWDKHHAEMGVTREDYEIYLHGASIAYLLILHRIQRLTPPLTLDDMRQASAFQPPRSYRYMNRSTLRKLVNGHPAGENLLSLLRT